MAREDWDDVRDPFLARRQRIRTEMGGADRVSALHAAGQATARDWIAALVDEGSFQEVGTFAWAAGRDEEWQPGDGKIGGYATVGGRPVAVAGDDVTVKRATSAMVGNEKFHRLFESAMRAGTPFVYFGSCGGGRIPDILGATGFTAVRGYEGVARRRRAIPLVAAIVGDSFGASSLLAGHADLTVQMRGTCLAVTAPSVIEVATGEAITPEDLGGVAVHSERTGLVDVVADDLAGVVTTIERFLSYLPSHAGTEPPRSPCPDVANDPGLLDLVPRARRSAYDMSAVVDRIVDPGSYFAIGARFGRSLLTGLARLGGIPIGLIANQPSYQAGSLTPDACDKAIRLMCLCDAFGLPIVMLQDTPGFLVGSGPEHDRLVAKADVMQQAYALAAVPKVTLLLRKGFGLGYYAMGGNDVGGDALFAWAGSEIGFMDPVAGANVVYAAEIARLPPDQRDEHRRRRAAQLEASTKADGPAAAMRVDELIDPIESRPVLVAAVRRLSSRAVPAPRPLASWPTRW